MKLVVGFPLWARWRGVGGMRKFEIIWITFLHGNYQFHGKITSSCVSHNGVKWKINPFVTPAVCSSRAVRQRLKCPKVKSRGNFFHANGQQLLSSRHSPLLLTVHSLPSIIGSLEFTKTWQQNWNLIKISKKSVVFEALMLQHALLFCQSSAALTVGKLTIQEITNAKCGMFGFLESVRWW